MPSEEVTFIQHFARSVFLGQDWRKCFMAFTANFDASGGSSEVAKVVAGYMARVEDWERFDADWRLVLAHDNVPYFHMKEFAHFKCPYADWRGQDTRRANFLARLVGVAADHLRRRASSVVLIKDFNEVDKIYPLSEIFDSPYVLAARTCVAKMRLWMESNDYNEPLRCIFEGGDSDVNKGLLIKRFSMDGFPAPTFEPKRDESGRWHTPFQAADFAAWELLKGMRSAEQGLIRSLRDLRPSLLRLGAIPADDGTFERDDLIRSCETAKWPKRSEIRDTLSHGSNAKGKAAQ